MTQLHLVAAQLRNRLNLRDDRGVTAVEYGLLLLGIAFAVGVAAVAFGIKVVALYSVVTF